MDSTVGADSRTDSVRDAQHLLRAHSLIMNTLREGFALLDPRGRIESTNAAFDRMFGHSLGDLAGTFVMDLFNAGRRRRDSPPSIERVLKRLESRTGKRPVMFRRRDGSQFAGELCMRMMQIDGQPKGLVVIQDVSERQRFEREIIEIANRERRRQSSDLHDGLGQELTGISLMLRSLTTRLGAAAAEVAPELDEIIALVNHAIQSARTMALGLSPVIRANGGLQSALASLAGWARANYHIDVRLRLATPPVLAIDEAAATHLYLIAQESINNAVKHGRANKVSISLRANHRILTLNVSDDGIGIDDNPVRTTGMGLKIMEYRAGMIGGSLSIQQPKRGGTRVRCICPQVPEPGVSRL